jgi:hypothetical protein
VSTMPQKRSRPRRRNPYGPYPANTMMRGMMDMGKMAVGGAVVIGTIGAVGSIIPKSP